MISGDAIFPRRRLSLWGGGLLLLLAMGLAWPGAAVAIEPLGFALLSSRSESETLALWRPLLDRLSEQLGVPVVAHWYPDYAGAIWGLRSGRDRLAFLGNKAAIEAVEYAGAEVFAAPTEITGQSVYHSIMIVAAGSPYQEAGQVLAAAAAITLGIGDPNSTSGTVVPRHYLFHPRGIEPRDRFLRVVVGSHPDNIRGVIEGRLDVAMVSSRSLAYVLAATPDLAGTVREIWRSPPIPASPLVWRRDLPELVKARVRSFFLGLGESQPGKREEERTAERAALDRLDLLGFQAADDQHLAPVRRLDLLDARWRLERDTGPEADRAAKLAEIDRKLAEIDRRPLSAAADVRPAR